MSVRKKSGNELTSLWEYEGKLPEGREMDFWLQAERELSADETDAASKPDPLKD
jgi:hypothetical protein